jgi:short-subunit dehydrogenase
MCILLCAAAAKVLGADTPMGQRVALSLAINGARLALLGRAEDKSVMEQVGLS